MIGINCLVPAPANSKIAALGKNVLEPRIAKPAQDFRGPVGRMVIDDDYVEVEIRALPESALHSVENGSLSIPHGYDDAGLYRRCSRPIRHFLEARLEPGTDSFQMRRCHALHFNLVVAIAWIHIIELLLTGRPHIG